MTVVDVLGLDVAQAAAYLKDFGSLPGRGQRLKLRLPDGRGIYTLIDDSYSGQPESMKLAIGNLSRVQACPGRKIAVLGKMAELGAASREKHIEIGQAVDAADVDIVIGVCPEMKDMLAQLDAGREQYYLEIRGLDEFLLNNLLQNNDIVLIKGARYSSKLYQVTESLVEKGK